MPVLSSAVSALSTFYQDSLDPSTRSRSRSRRSGCWPSSRRSRHTPTRSRSVSPSSTRTTTSARRELPPMTFGVPATTYDLDPEMVKVLDLLLILHADHEQNCSTSTVRLVGSSHANLFARCPRGSMPSSAHSTVAPTRPSWRCSNASTARTTTSTPSRPRSRTRRTASVSWASGTGSPQELRPARRSSRRPPTNSSTGWAANRRTARDIAMRARGDRVGRRLLRRAQALPECRLLHRPDLQVDGLPSTRCSPCSLPSAASRAGSPSGAEMIEDPATKIGRRGRSTSAGSATTSPCPRPLIPQPKPNFCVTRTFGFETEIASRLATSASRGRWVWPGRSLR